MREMVDAYIKENLGIDDKETLDMLYEDFLRTVRENIDKIQKALEADDAEALRFASHALKGCAANIGAEPIRALCFDMEMSAKRGETAFSRTNLPKLLELQTQL